jgi:hypothetical protein
MNSLMMSKALPLISTTSPTSTWAKTGWPRQSSLPAAPWTTYSILAQIAAAQGDPVAARRWRRQEQESYAAYAGAAHQLPSWAPDFINSVAAAAQGVAEAQEAVAQILPQLEGGGWTNLAAAVKRILAGEQDDETLFDELDRQDAYIIQLILQQLAGGTPAPDEQIGPVSQTGPISPDAAPAAPEEAGISLEELLQLVVAAARGEAPPELGVQLHAVTRGLATDANAPPALQALGRALNAILSGERQPDLAGLPPDLAAAVQQVLGQLGARP